MIRQRTFRFISALISLLFAGSIFAQQPEQSAPVPQQTRTRGIQYQPTVDSLKAVLQQRQVHWLEGMSISGDLLGLIMHRLANYGQLEGAFRLNIKGRYFPTAEVGLGYSNHTNEETELHFKTNSPYFRIGCDYNFSKDVLSGNRVFGGFRIGYSNFKYDLTGPNLIDPIWQDSAPYNFPNLKASATWGELLFGLEAKIWENFHIGWSVRYRMRFNQKESSVGQAWYVPGFGKNDTHNFGGTFNLIFDI